MLTKRRNAFLVSACLTLVLLFGKPGHDIPLVFEMNPSVLLQYHFCFHELSMELVDKESCTVGLLRISCEEKCEQVTYRRGEERFL